MQVRGFLGRWRRGVVCGFFDSVFILIGVWGLETGLDRGRRGPMCMMMLGVSKVEEWQCDLLIF